jgi:predicted dehydrogenase
MPVRLALVGAGRWGRNYIRTIAALDGVQLVAIASRNAETATLVPAGCRVVPDWRLLVDANDVDGVVIASPPSTHADILIAAVERGKAVLVEKPVVMSRADAARVRAAVTRQPAVVSVDHTFLVHPAFRALCREATALGPIRSIKSSAGNHGPYRRDASVLWDWAPHDLAMCLTLLPGPARIENAWQDERQVIQGVIAERIVLELKFATVPATVTVSTLDDRHRWFAARFDSCTLVFRDFVDDKLTRFAPDADITADVSSPVTVDPELPLTRAVLDFAESITTRNVSRRSIDLGLEVVEIAAEAEAILAAR